MVAENAILSKIDGTTIRIHTGSDCYCSSRAEWRAVHDGTVAAAICIYIYSRTGEKRDPGFYLYTYIYIAYTATTDLFIRKFSDKDNGAP